MFDTVTATSRVVVLVEGRSDAAVVQALADARGIGGELDVVSMDGVTNVRRFLSLAHRERPGRPVLGLCDAPEERVVATALAELGLPVRTRQDLADHGFFVCDADLEDELMRALGAESVEAALADIGHLRRFRTFQRQPEWRERTLHDQLHRFAGSAGGRKLLLAQRLAALLTPDLTPAPLVGLLDRVQRQTSDS